MIFQFLPKEELEYIMKKKIIDYICIISGAFLVALGVNVFLVPLNISTGGVSGIGTVLYHTLDIPLWITTVVLNAVLFIFGYRTLDKSACFKTVFGILSLTIFLAFTQYIPVFTDDIFISSVFGGVIAGTGVGLTVLKGASTGGSDFTAMMLHKVIPHISVANFILVIDVVVITASGIVFGDYTLMFYSFIALFISSKVTDYILVSGNFAKCIYILSEKHEVIADYIMREMNRGVTGIGVKGLYTGKDGRMLMCVVTGKQVPSLIYTIKSIDKSAFTVISDVREVHGAGFIGTI